MMEQYKYKPIPIVRAISNTIVQKNYAQIKKEIEEMINAEVEQIINDTARQNTILKKT